ncbi:UPF0187 protein [Seminavis robusta]|uniref:UPF0187 protein n=1 Tax=Seminavis robusta TaxID=568900 RepID=A0A9N8DBT6_9STRA|nr:UPF0187 protein [Seminavis robusta]|eukprot:Sro80_g043250.1 UPF0187 protein (493) ;mRNA; r:108781-110441
MRLQACIALALLLAADTESFTATRTRSGSGFASRTQQQSSQRSSVSRRKRQLPTTTSAFLYSAQFQPLNEGLDDKVNNRHSANDYWYNIRTLPSSTILREIGNPVLAVFGWSTAVSVLHHLLASSGRSALQVMASRLCVSSAAHSFLVSSLGLLLVFRTNSAYQRFNEGRKIWEQILSVSRNLSRLSCLYGREIGPSRRHRIRNLIAAFPYLLRHHIRSGCLCEQGSIDERYRLLLEEPAQQMVETRHEGDKRCGGSTNPADHMLPPKECWVDRRNLPWSLIAPGALEKVAKARNRPLWICDRLGREICDIPYGPNFTNRERQHFLSQVEKLTDAIGKCERIHQTAVPLNYARHSLRSLTLWLLTLPFTMVKDLGFMTGPAAAVIAWLMFGIYQIGYSIEDPFQGSLRLSILCDAIREDVMGNLDDDDQDMVEDQARDSAYHVEATSWIDDAADNTLAPTPLPPQILTSKYSVVTTTKSPLFSMADYKALEQ